MARETKVGLLAGLAFIICFAVILTNRGRDNVVAPPRPVLSDSGGLVPSNLQQTASRTPVRPPITTPTTGAELVLLDRGQIPPASAPIVQAPVSGERNLTSHSTDPAAVATLPQTTPVQPSSTNPATESAPTVRTYAVASGDTLSKIALAQYGDKSRATIDAIFAANRAEMQNPDTLRVGMKLTLPNLPVVDASMAASGTPSAPSRREPSAENRLTQANAPVNPPDPAFRFYQVKKNDRWLSIARDQLGDARRWRELHELNKDKFPDPQIIREGVRIKLPATRSSHASGSRS